MAASWADWYHETARIAALFKLTIVGGLLTYAGGGMLYTKIRPEIMGTRATAVLLERYVVCTVVRGKGRDRAQEQMPCPETERMQSVSDSGKIGVRRDDMVRLQIALPDGSVHETKVAEHKVHSSGVPLEGRLPVVFDRLSPDDARAPAEAKDVAIRLGILAFGLLLLVFPALSALNWLRGGPKAATPSAPARHPGSRISEVRATGQTAHAVRQPTIQPARLAAVTRRGPVVATAGGPRGNIGA